MKKLCLSVSFLFLTLLTVYAQEPTPATEAGEDFDLSAVMEVMENAEDIADLEKKINDSENQINYLDLNKDDEIDIVKIVELDEGQTRVFVLRAVLGENDFQDVATIEIEKHTDTEISLQIIGDPDLYGEDYILEPAEESGSGGHGALDCYLESPEIPEYTSAAVFVSVHLWRPIRPLFVVGRIAFVSAVGWRPLPVWFVVRRPIARATWRGRTRRYRRNRYRSTRNRHSRNASRMYSNKRKKSNVAKRNVGPKPSPSPSPAKTTSKQQKSKANTGPKKATPAKKTGPGKKQNSGPKKKRH